MVYYAFEEHLNARVVSDSTPCDYCGQLIHEGHSMLEDAVTGHLFCSETCGAAYLKHNTPAL